MHSQIYLSWTLFILVIHEFWQDACKAFCSANCCCPSPLPPRWLVFVGDTTFFTLWFSLSSKLRSFVTIPIWHRWNIIPCYFTHLMVTMVDEQQFHCLIVCSNQFGTDTESARASRKQYKETLYSVLFDMNVPAVCAVDQVCILMSLLATLFDQMLTFITSWCTL
jgi:hypothetical protein